MTYRTFSILCEEPSNQSQDPEGSPSWNFKIDFDGQKQTCASRHVLRANALSLGGGGSEGIGISGRRRIFTKKC